jgi:putative toxin-antitoxin system antitoxin component (TIGR02293 family)
MAAPRQLRTVAAHKPKRSASRDIQMTQENAQADIFRRAAEVIGSNSEAMRWMGTPVRALDYATPVSLLHDAKGIESVRSVLGRLEHGVL